jgi:hypothetical protein
LATAFALLSGSLGVSAFGQDSVEDRLRLLTEQNRLLQAQVQAQQKQLDAFAEQLKEVRLGDERHEQQLRDLRAGPAPAAGSSAVARREGDVRLSGEIGLGLFRTGAAGSFPKSTFRVDDAKIFVEAPVIKDTYFFGEVDLMTREGDSSYFELGELYLDLENVSGRLGGPARLLNVRVGRVYSPFGEEYSARSALADPLISHSLADIWGVDAGVEAYGSAGAWHYAVAVQNGGNNVLHDYNADKAVVARVGWDPAQWLHVSTSVMRTGDLRVGTTAAPGDFSSSLWFGNGFFRAIGAGRATDFSADLWEGDAVARWKGGHLGLSAGAANYRDNDLTADNSRLLHFGFVEAAHAFTEEWFAAARYSWIDVPRGYPLVGWGNFGRYFFAPPLTTALRRMSLGFGYRLGPPLVLKLEYTWEAGRMTSGARRDQENFFGAQAGLKF